MMSRVMRSMWIPLLCAVTAAAASSVELTEGKIELELGQLEAAVQHFTEVSRDETLPAPLRQEAMLRLAQVERSRGNHEAAVAAFRAAAELDPASPEMRWRLAEAVTGVRPDLESWQRHWSSVELYVFDSDPPTVAVSWPTARGCFGPPEGEPITLSLEGASIRDVVNTFGAVTGLQTSIDPCVDGTVSGRFNQVPWDLALYNLLGSLGLGCEIQDGVLRVTCPDQPETTTVAAQGVDDRLDPVELPEGDSTTPAVSVLVHFGGSSSTTASPCTQDPILEVDLTATTTDKLAHLLVRRLSEHLVGSELLTIELCGTCQDMKDVARIVAAMSDSPYFMDTYLRRVDRTDDGMNAFRLTARHRTEAR